MSVLKAKRTTSKAEFVNTANAIYTETINFLTRLSARYARLLADPTAKMAAEVVDNTEKARLVLKEHGLTVGSTSVVAVEVDDTPGGLDHILRVLSGAGINVEYMYAFVQRSSENATLIFRFDRTEQALDVLKQHGIPVLSSEMICR